MEQRIFLKVWCSNLNVSLIIFTVWLLHLTDMWYCASPAVSIVLSFVNQLFFVFSLLNRHRQLNMCASQNEWNVLSSRFKLNATLSQQSYASNVQYYIGHSIECTNECRKSLVAVRERNGIFYSRFCTLKYAFQVWI